MKKILLIINNDKTRQLYHRILLSRGIEVIPVADLVSAILNISLDKFDLIILDASISLIETEVFLRIRQKHKYLSKTKIIILSNDNNFKPKISKNDLIIYTSEISIKNIINQIEKMM